jgi:hypothetical protein
MMYQVQAQVRGIGPGVWHYSRQVPTFFVDCAAVDIDAKVASIVGLTDSETVSHTAIPLESIR